jgi:hypothetical protein
MVVDLNGVANERLGFVDPKHRCRGSTDPDRASGRFLQLGVGMSRADHFVFPSDSFCLVWSSCSVGRPWTRLGVDSGNVYRCGNR